jgi:hypothetical protein
VEEKGKGFCKINNSILNDKDYQDKINDIILKYSAKINNDLKNCRLFNTYWFNFTPVDSRLEMFIN